VNKVAREHVAPSSCFPLSVSLHQSSHRRVAVSRKTNRPILGNWQKTMFLGKWGKG